MNRVRAKRILTSSLMIGLVLSTSCKKEEALEVENLLDNIQAQEIEEVTELPKEFLQAQANFSLDLFKELAEEENAVYSQFQCIIPWDSWRMERMKQPKVKS